MVEATADSAKGLLTSHGIQNVYHYAPLHYILFVARSKALLSKMELRRLGYKASHFRRTSRGPDDQRGFSNYVHLSLNPYPPILVAKLKRGFPHFEVRVPAAQVENSGLHLCRYNIARSRNIRTGKRPPPESAATGRYHGDKHLPTAETIEECENLLRGNLGRNAIEVLVPSRLPLFDRTELIFFSEADRSLVESLLRPIKLNWGLHLAKDLPYMAARPYVNDVKRFLERVRIEPEWLGDGLDFDHV